MLLNWSNSQGLNALMNSAEFIAGFADKGSGEVDLVLSKGTGSATFTRATTATTVNSAGTIISVASGTPRSYYDPTTLQYLGYLAEGARTNLLTQSQTFASWSDNNCSVSTSGTSPSGASDATVLTRGAGAATECMKRLGTAQATSTAYTLSVFAKAGTDGFLRLRNLALEGTSGNCWFNLNSGTVGTLGANVTSASIKAYPNGWYRCSMTGTTQGAIVSNLVDVGSSSADNSVAGTANTGTISIWGAQLEAGSFASSYIPTTTGTVPRNADVLTYPQSGNVSTTQGSAYAEIFALWNSGGANPQSIIKTGVTGAVGNRVMVTSAATANSIQIFDGTNVNAYTVSNFSTAQRKAASSWGSGGMFITAAGAAAATTAFDGDLGGAGLAVGCSTDGGEQFFGCIRNTRIYSTQLSASQLQAVTV